MEFYNQLNEPTPEQECANQIEAGNLVKYPEIELFYTCRTYEQMNNGGMMDYVNNPPLIHNTVKEATQQFNKLVKKFPQYYFEIVSCYYDNDYEINLMHTIRASE